MTGSRMDSKHNTSSLAHSDKLTTNIQQHEQQGGHKKKNIKECKFCLVWFFEDAFEQHKAQCKGTMGAPCKICSQWFPKTLLEMHETMCKHGDPKWEQCALCEDWFGTGSGLTSHQRFCCQGKPARTCIFCARFFMKMDINDHKRSCKKYQEWTVSVAAKSIVACKFCRKRFFNKQNLQMHERSCKRMWVLSKCQFCNKYFTGIELQTHVEICKSEKSECAIHEKSCEEKNEMGEKQDNKYVETENKTENNQMTGICLFCRLPKQNCSCLKIKNKQCRFCLDWFSESLFRQHEPHCSDKLATACRFCKEYFSYIGIKQHEQSCGGLSQTKRMCTFCLDFFPNGKLHIHERFCIKQIRHLKCKYCLRMYTKNAFVRHELMCKQKLAVACQFCKDLLPGSELKTHEQSCPKQPKQKVGKLKTTVPSRHENLKQNELKRDLCRICGRWITNCDSESHQRSCLKSYQMQISKMINETTNDNDTSTNLLTNATSNLIETIIPVTDAAIFHHERYHPSESDTKCVKSDSPKTIFHVGQNWQYASSGGLIDQNTYEPDSTYNRHSLSHEPFPDHGVHDPDASGCISPFIKHESFEELKDGSKPETSTKNDATIWAPGRETCIDEVKAETVQEMKVENDINVDIRNIIKHECNPDIPQLHKEANIVVIKPETQYHHMKSE